MTFQERIREIRKSAGKTQADFGRSLGLSAFAASNWEKKDFQMPTDTIKRLICATYGINLQWLETGEGEMRQPETNETFDALSQEYHLDPMESAAVRAFVSLPEEKRSAVLDAVRAIVREMDIAKLAEIEAENAELESRTPDPADTDDSQMA